MKTKYFNYIPNGSTACGEPQEITLAALFGCTEMMRLPGERSANARDKFVGRPLRDMELPLK
jgi:hypothetical protein